MKFHAVESLFHRFLRCFNLIRLGVVTYG